MEDALVFRIGRKTFPFSYRLWWNRVFPSVVMKVICGGSKGWFLERSMLKKNVPFSYGVSSGPIIKTFIWRISFSSNTAYIPESLILDCFKCSISNLII